MKNNQRGFSLIELIVVMAVFTAVIMITGSSFNTILTQASKLFRSEESNVEGIVGLEMLRHDLQQAGYGLFTETTNAEYADEAADTPSSDYNDAPDNVPRPIVTGNNLASGTAIGTNTVLAGSDYLAIKGTTVGRNRAAQKWTFLRISSGSVRPQQWASDAENLTASPTQERVVVIQKQFGTPMRSNLVRDPGNNFYYDYSAAAFGNLSSASAAIYTAYGVDEAALRFPFNRSDYFVATPDAASNIPAFCAPGTGVLYKTIVSHTDDGTLNYLPVLDCVLDMQVVLGWDMDSDGVIDTYSDADGSQVSSGITEGNVSNVQAALANTNNNTIVTTPSIRNNLKIIKVYVIAQNGRKDTGYTSASPLMIGDTGEASLTRSAGLTLAANQLNYRWKQYRIVVRPKNLLANQ